MPPPTPTSPKITRMSWRCGSPGTASAVAARLPSLSMATGYAAPRRAAQLGADRDVAPAQVGADGEHLAGAVEQAGDADGEADGRAAAGADVGVGALDSSTSRSSTSSAVSLWASRASRCSATTSPAEVEGDGGDVVDVDLGADPADRARRRARPTVPGRPMPPRSTPAARTRPRSASSATRLETAARVRPSSAASRARERGPWSRSWRRTRERLVLRTRRTCRPLDACRRPL